MRFFSLCRRMNVVNGFSAVPEFEIHGEASPWIINGVHEANIEKGGLSRAPVLSLIMTSFIENKCESLLLCYCIYLLFICYYDELVINV